MFDLANIRQVHIEHQEQQLQPTSLSDDQHTKHTLNKTEAPWQALASTLAEVYNWATTQTPHLNSQ